jgi:hypothetical protein
MKKRIKHIDMSVFADFGQISIGRLYVHHYHELFSSTVVNNVIVDIDQFVINLRGKFDIKVLGVYHTIHHKPNESSLCESYYRDQFKTGIDKFEELEIFLQAADRILISIKPESFRIVYGMDIPTEVINNIETIYYNSKIEDK